MRLPASGPSAIGLLKVLLAASLLGPLALFAVTAWLNYRAILSDVERELRQTTEVAREHAAKVFDSQNLVADRVSDLVAGMSIAEIQRSEAALHTGLGTVVGHLAQVQSVLLASADGHPLVSAGTYPVDRTIDLRQRDYFRAAMDGTQGNFVSSLQVGDINRQPFFGVSRPWLSVDGQLLGVIDVAISPTFFRDFYAALVGESGDVRGGRVITLLRSDGQTLVRFPPFPGPPPRAKPEGMFFRAIAADPNQGTYQDISIAESPATARVYAYSRVQDYPLYVVAGLSRSVILANWQRTLASHALFGVPATLALVAVTWTALVRARREAAALERANEAMKKQQTAEAALLRAQRLEAVGQMTGGVAHDFNNLLTIILGSAEMLARRAHDPDRVRVVAEQIVQAAKRGGEVTQQLLAFSRRQLVNPERVDLNRRLREFKPLLDRAARDAVQVVFRLDAELNAVRLDPGHFEAAILNLVGNARDAMPDGGTVTISTGNVGGFVRVAVTDTGCGMPPEIVARAFEPFFTTKDVGHGTGLGLSQVYGFAKQAGGDVRITSVPGEGSTVEILLPKAGGEAAEGASPVARQAPREVSGEVVLVVEDEAGVLGMTVESLRDLGYVAIPADDARAALDLLRGADRFDVLLSDVQMPGGITGVQLAEEAMRIRPGIKVLLTSGYTTEADTRRAQRFALLTKPYDRAQLALRLQGVLQG